MKKSFFTPALIISALSIGASAQACDMHGGGFGFGMQGANWKSFNPQASTFDPTYNYENKELVSPLEKSKPSFSNAANMAALRAKARLAKKSEKASADKAKDKAVVKKASLDADR